MPAEIPDAYADLVSESVIATIGTLNSSGSVHLTGVWTERDGSDFWVNTTTASVKYKNMRARPDVTLIWYDPTNPYRYVSLRGRAVEFLGEPAAREQLDRLSERYTGARATGQPSGGGGRVGIRITPDHVIAYG